MIICTAVVTERAIQQEWPRPTTVGQVFESLAFRNRVPIRLLYIIRVSGQVLLRHDWWLYTGRKEVAEKHPQRFLDMQIVQEKFCEARGVRLLTSSITTPLLQLYGVFGSLVALKIYVTSNV